MSIPDNNICGAGACKDDCPKMNRFFSLYEKIDKVHMECINESVEGSGRKVFRPWSDRLCKSMYVESDISAELIFNIPFTGNVKLLGLMIIGENDGTFPAKVRLFKNRQRMAFHEVGLSPDQEFQITPDENGIVECQTRMTSFTSVYHLTIHIPMNHGASQTRISYIGLKGEFHDENELEVLSHSIPFGTRSGDSSSQLDVSEPKIRF